MVGRVLGRMIAVAAVVDVVVAAVGNDATPCNFLSLAILFG